MGYADAWTLREGHHQTEIPFGFVSPVLDPVVGAGQRSCLLSL